MCEKGLRSANFVSRCSRCSTGNRFFQSHNTYLSIIAQTKMLLRVTRISNLRSEKTIEIDVEEIAILLLNAALWCPFHLVRRASTLLIKNFGSSMNSIRITLQYPQIFQRLRFPDLSLMHRRICRILELQNLDRVQTNAYLLLSNIAYNFSSKKIG